MSLSQYDMDPNLWGMFQHICDIMPQSINAILKAKEQKKQPNNIVTEFKWKVLTNQNNNAKISDFYMSMFEQLYNIIMLVRKICESLS